MRPIRWLRRGVLLVGLGAAGGALFVTARHILETPQPLQSGLPGEARIDRKHGGDIYYNVAGDESAEPIVLLHDFYTGASNFEYRHLFPRLIPTWRVYAPDWLGFGMSEHPALAYTGEFYANILLGFLRDVVGRPAVVVGHGRAANIAVRAAADAPDLFSQLALVSPDVEAGVELEPKVSQLLARASQRVSLGLAPYAFLSTKPLLRRLAHKRSAQTGEASAGEETVEHMYASAHQFGGQHAQLALLTGELDLPIQNIFPLLQPPVLLFSGDEDPARPLAVMEDLAVLNPHADLDVLTSSGDAVFEDQPALFAEALLGWLATTPARQHPQVEEQHPVGTDSAKSDDAHGTLAEPDTSEKTVEVSDRPVESSQPASQPMSQPTRKSASAPAARTTGSAASKSVSASDVSGGERPPRTARNTSQQARQHAAPRPKAETPTARKPNSQRAGSKKGDSSAQQGKGAKGAARKHTKTSQNSD